MTEETVEVANAFPYPDGATAAWCEDRAVWVEREKFTLVRVNIEGMIKMGRWLNEVRVMLPGQYEAWVEWRLPWARETARKWRCLAQRVDGLSSDKGPKFWALLGQFRSTTAALEFVQLEEPVQQAVVEAGAWSWTEFDAVCWRERMRERLEDEALDHDHRYGDVLHAIDEVRHDESTSEPLREAAQELYEEHEETFVRLADREPAELAVETGIGRRREPEGDRPGAQLVETDGGYWLCRKVCGEFVAVAPVASYVLMWNGAGEPSVLAAFPRTTDGPASASWQRAGMDAFCEKLNATTLAERYGGVVL